MDGAARLTVSAGTTTDAASVRATPALPPGGALRSSLRPSPMRTASSNDVPSATSADAGSSFPPLERTEPLPYRLFALFVGRKRPDLLTRSGDPVAVRGRRGDPLRPGDRDGGVEAAQRPRPSQQLQRLEQRWGNGPAGDSNPNGPERMLGLEP